jgi:hypothetical protein
MSGVNLRFGFTVTDSLPITATLLHAVFAKCFAFLAVRIEVDLPMNNATASRSGCQINAGSVPTAVRTAQARELL